MSLSSKQIRLILKELSPTPGYILNHTRVSFETLFDELEPEVDIMGPDFEVHGNSVAKRFKAFLELASDEHVDIILTSLRK